MSRPPIPRGLPNADRDSLHLPQYGLHHSAASNPPVSPPPSSLPNSYEIPSLRSKPLPELPQPSQISHSRSFSHPFPSFFGGKKHEKKAQQQRAQDEIDSSEDESSWAKGYTTKNKKATRAAAAPTPTKQPATGNCITCDSVLRWPQDLKTFRCTTCLTINDLEPIETQPSTHPAGGAYRRPMPVSLERTKRLIDTCIDEFFQNMLQNDWQSQSKAYETESLFISDEDAFEPTGHRPSFAGAQNGLLDPPRPRFTDRSPSEPATLYTRSTRDISDLREQGVPMALRENHHADYHHPLNSPSGVSQSFHPNNQIFRGLESYLASCLTGCTPLNISFFSVKPFVQREDRAPRPRHVRQQPSDIALTPLSEPEMFLSELDAKTLLLGDVVENGSWWTGKIEEREEPQTETTRERSPERWRGVVSARTPRINWLELVEWYRLILHAGDDWQKRWMSLRTTLSQSKLERWSMVSMETMHKHFIESQIHLQRSFLKATENLLKRPRRPLSSPEDCRFLPMLLANPLLSPNARNSAARNTGDIIQSNAAPRRNNSGLGRHSGIIKRILGLMAHLSDDIHLYLISWFSRFSDTHLAALVDLVGRFVTYRLTRQSEKRVQSEIDPTAGLIPSFTEGGVRHPSQVHAALDRRSQKQAHDGKPRIGGYSEDWQLRAAARVMALLFQSNTNQGARKRDTSATLEQRQRSAGTNVKHQAHTHGQMIPISNFYNSLLDHADLVADFETWETTKTKFTFCRYPFFLSIWAKIRILEYDARRQMELKAREAFFDSILSRKAVSQYLVLKVRRDCLVDDSLKSVSEVIGRGGNDIKKGIRIDFVGEEGVDAGGLRKEWFLLLVREIFNPNHGLFVYDEDSKYCYFNPFCFESSEQFFLVGVLLGLAIYNSTILDIAFPPFVFKKMLASAPAGPDKMTSTPKVSYRSSLDDLAELKPTLARGLRQLLEFEGDVQEVFCRDFVVEMERYGGNVQMPLCTGGASRPVTNANRREFVDLYVYYLLDQSVARQYEPFKRGFFTVCGGNALSLFRPEEIELLVRGSDEPLDVKSLRAVASYDGWPKTGPAHEQPQVVWFWEFFEKLSPVDQRKLLGFITGSDRIPAMGAVNLVIRVQLLSDPVADEIDAETQRLPIARTCFNLLGLYEYRARETLERKLWTAVTSSEGFGLK